MPATENTSPGMEESLQEVLQRLADPSARTRPMVARERKPGHDDPTVLAAVAHTAAGPRPWFSASASLLIWGGGQWVNRQRPLAMLFLSLEALAIAIAWCLHQTWSSWVWLADLFFIEELALRTSLATTGLLIPAVGILGVVQAYLYAEHRPGARPPARLGPLPTIASALIPGWGQILNGQLGKAVGFLCGSWFALYVVAMAWLQPDMWTRIDPSGVPLAGTHLSLGALMAVVVGVLAWVLSVYDAALTARGRGRTEA